MGLTPTIPRRTQTHLSHIIGLLAAIQRKAATLFVNYICIFGLQETEQGACELAARTHSPAPGGQTEHRSDASQFMSDEGCSWWRMGR